MKYFCFKTVFFWERFFLILQKLFKMMRKIFFLKVVLLSLLLNACGNRFEVDISNIEAQEVTILRYEEALFSEDIDQERIVELQKAFPLFLGDMPLDPIQLGQLKAYVDDELLTELYKRTKQIYPNLNSIEQELSLSFRYLEKYYPAFVNPQIYTYLSGVQDDIFYQDQVVMLSIDQYLGKDFEVYKQLQIPRYKQYRKTKEYVVKDILMTIAIKHVPSLEADARLLEQMLYEGKLLFFIKSMMPNISDHLLFGQTNTHLSWLQNKESELWRYYIENELLFKSDHLVYNKFINDAPFTALLGDDSAPRTGIWLGYQIISSYVEQTDANFLQIINNNQAQQILQRSKYKP